MPVVLDAVDHLSMGDNTALPEMPQKKSTSKACANVRQVIVDKEEEFLDAITHTAAAVKCGWRALITIKQQEMEFKIDTGAEVTVIPEDHYIQERDGRLAQVNGPLNGPSRQRLEVSGRFHATLKWKNTETSQDIYVVHAWTADTTFWAVSHRSAGN